MVDAGNRFGTQKTFSRSNLPEMMITCVKLKRI